VSEPALDRSIPGESDVIVLARRPGRQLAAGDLVLERRPLRPAGPGEVVVRNVVTTVDPLQLQTLRGSTEITAVGIGDPVAANSVGFVVQSQDPRAPVGTQVATYTGWQEYATTTLDPAEIADPALGDPLRWISLLGTTGVTAYVGMHLVGNVQAGQNVLVNAASGSVGGVAVQLAKAAGARVVAVAGGKDRVAHALDTLGADAAVDYRDAAFPMRLTDAAGSGFDLFFDSVGGEQLTLGLAALKDFGLVVLCGSVSGYAAADDRAALSDLRAAVFKRATLRGFIVSDFYPQHLQSMREELSRLANDGKISQVISEFDGLERAPDVLASLFQSGTSYLGRRVIRIGSA
jgi:NADPH-dependent curcumin reductase CurA